MQPGGGADFVQAAVKLIEIQLCPRAVAVAGPATQAQSMLAGIGKLPPPVLWRTRAAAKRRTDLGLAVSGTLLLVPTCFLQRWRSEA